MKALKSWLEDYVKIGLSDAELIEKLNLTGTEVDSATSTLDEKVIVVEIKEVKKHPNADKLNLATVFDGKNELEIVCGAPNIAVGQKVPLAQIGTKLGDFEIKEAIIRGIKSSGMLCAEDELGLGEDHSGIMILPDNYELGKSLSEYIKSDLVLDLEITTNRGDCLSHVGLAREIAAFSNETLKEEKVDNEEESSSDLKVDIESNDCPQYFGRVIEGVKIGQSPLWLQKRLVACGAKPINNVVDITNYILLDLGQPLHSFDADKVKDRHIIVRKAKKYENIITLDGETRQLSEEDLVIADPEKALAIAGTMGGENSEISDSTTKVILESAEFDRKSIRKTSKSLKLVTEASYRYERGIDSGSVEKALNKAAKMIVELAGGKLVGSPVKAGSTPEKKSVEIKYDKINQLLGLNLTKAAIEKILVSLGFLIDKNFAVIPLWRHDIEGWQDLAEEVGRIHGYEKIDPLAVEKTDLSKEKNNYHLKEYVKDILVDCGFGEVSNYAFLSEADAAISKTDTQSLMEVSNPVQPENKYLRNTLIPGLLKSVAKNPSFDPIQFFEVGNVFTKETEATNLGVIVAGKGAKKLIDTVITKIKEETGITSEIASLEISADDLLRYKIKKPVVHAFELPISQLTKALKQKAEIDLKLKLSDKQIHYRPVSRFPSIVRDIAFIADETVNSDDVTNLIYEQSELINRVELFDEFASGKFGVGKKNIAYHIDLQDLKKTLTDKEAEEVITKITEAVKAKFDAKLRNY